MTTIDQPPNNAGPQSPGETYSAVDPVHSSAPSFSDSNTNGHAIPRRLLEGAETQRRDDGLDQANCYRLIQKLPTVKTSNEASVIAKNQHPSDFSRIDTEEQDARPTGFKKQEQDCEDEHSAQKLSPDKLRELAYSPESLPVTTISSDESSGASPSSVSAQSETMKNRSESWHRSFGQLPSPVSPTPLRSPYDAEGDRRKTRNLTVDTTSQPAQDSTSSNTRPRQMQRALSTPATGRTVMSPRKAEKSRPEFLDLDVQEKQAQAKPNAHPTSSKPLPSPMPKALPLPPMSIPTYLQLELSSQRPSQLYIHRSIHNDFPYESSRVKIERLLNFLLLPLHLEGVLWFGALACLDAWLYTFTILPLRLLKSFYILAQSWSSNLAEEVRSVSQFIYSGTGRMWRRQRTRSQLDRRISGAESDISEKTQSNDQATSRPARGYRHHHRTKSVPSMLLADDKADMLKGLLIISTCMILLRFDASRMYHWIRGQAAIKLYVIYNVLEVCDRLFSAIGQDVLECLFSRETLERKPDGHSKILRPFWLFVLALAYTVIHSTALFYQVITLNVAVNSYSNALIALLMSNQFVEIKGTVFKKFEKENLFQLTCADVVERFQLWHMLVIIASRNIVQTGAMSKGFSALATASTTLASPLPTNTSVPITPAAAPGTTSSMLPRSFTLVPAVVNSVTSYVPTLGHVLGPFFVVLGSEMLVDWLKHAYINKFNNTRPAIYDRFLDVLAKDYYTNAFGDQNLTKRLGLPVIPLSCLLIRASVQTYQMFIAGWIPSVPPTVSTSLTSIHEQYTSSLGAIPTSTTTKLSRQLDHLLGGLPSTIASSNLSNHLTTVLAILLIFFVLLAIKLVLGMLLLAFSRARYRSMKEREKESIYHVDGGRRVGGWGVVEVNEDKRRWIYEDDPSGLRALQEREDRERTKRERDREKGIGVDSFDRVKRYEMVAKRIW